MKVGDLVAYKSHLKEAMEYGYEYGIVLKIRKCAIGNAVMIKWQSGVSESLKKNLEVVNRI